MTERVPHLLHDEDHAGQGRIEGRRQARGRPGRDERVPRIHILPRHQVVDERTAVAAHLHTRPLAPEDHAAAERQQPADELDRQHPPPAGRTHAGQIALDLLNTAAPGIRRKPPHEPEGQQQHDRRHQPGPDPTDDGIGGQLMGQTVLARHEALGAQLEQRAHQAGQGTDQAGHDLERAVLDEALVPCQPDIAPDHPAHGKAGRMQAVIKARASSQRPPWPFVSADPKRQR